MSWFNKLALGYFLLVMVMIAVLFMQEDDVVWFKRNSMNRDILPPAEKLVDTGVEYVDEMGELQKKRIALARLVGIPECQVMAGKHVIAPSELDLAAFMIAHNITGGDNFATVPGPAREIKPGQHGQHEHVSFTNLNLPTMDAKAPTKYLEKTRSGGFLPLPYREPIGVTTNEVMM